MKHQSKIFLRALSVSILVMALLVQTFIPSLASASQITDRKLTLKSKAPLSSNDGGSLPGGVVDHLFNFSLPSSTDVGSIEFEYCTRAGDDFANPVCVMPTGLVTTTATLGSETGAIGFSMVATTNGAPYLTRTAASVTPGAVSYQLNTVTNPTAANSTFFVRIKTYTSTDATGSSIDAGTVAASTATAIELTGTMPESLVFCAGATVGLTVGVPDCATATAGAITFDQMFSPTDTSKATSQMAASTNAGSGYAVTVVGPTLTSGSNTISAMSPAAASIKGVSQFGMNLKANTVLSTTVPVGIEVEPAANGSNYRGQATAGYNTVDSFKYGGADPGNMGEVVADSSNGGAGGTDAQIFTASYIVNVPGSQGAGTYTTTLTYICTPTF